MPTNNVPEDNNPRHTNGSAPGCQRRPSGPGVTVQIADYPIIVSATRMADPEHVHGLAAQCRDADGDPVFTIRDLLAWPDDARWSLLQLIATLERPYQVRLNDHDEAFDDLFAAVLHIAEGSEDINRCTNGRRAALEAAALCHPHSLEDACDSIVRRFRSLGVRGLRHDQLVRQVRNLVGNGEDRPDPTQAAADFHNHVRAEMGFAEGQWAIRYFQDDFFVWQGACWRRASHKEIEADVTQYLQDHARIANLTKRFVQDVMANLKGLTLLRGWDNQLPLWVRDEAQHLVEPSPYIVMQNRMVRRADLLAERPTTIRVRRHDPRNFSEIVLPYDYCRQADCPLWQQTLEEIFPSAADGDRRISVLQEFMGWSLVHGDTSFEKFLILLGDGANGKSTILRIWEQLLGSDNVSHVPLEALSSEFRLVDMMGKLANIAADMNRMDKVQEGMLKALTSGDRIQVNRKNKDPVTMRPTARLIFATNTLPPITDRSNGVWRRMIAMPFLVSFTGDACDRNRAERLLDELPGIFNWAVEGARRLYRQGHFTECSVCRACVDEHRVASDPFRQFVEEELQFNPDDQIPKETLYRRYRAFCEENGRRARSSIEFGRQMFALPGVTESRLGSGGRARTYRGVRFARKESPFHAPSDESSVSCRRNRRTCRPSSP